jgi:3-oxoacyl-[acyl-carrier-protein] synthase-3
MTDVFVGHLASALGSESRSVEHAEASGQLISGAAVLRKAGFGTHNICSPAETAYDLAAMAFRNSAIDPAVVDTIVYSTCLPLNGNIDDPAKSGGSRDVKQVMRFPASLLQEEFDLQRAFVIGLNQQACTGMLGALRIARNMIVAEADIHNILCITADRFPADAIYEQSFNLVSDGAAACLVSREPAGLRLVAAHHITNGAMVDASDDETVGLYFNYTCRLIDELLDRAELTIRDIRWIVPQNINRQAWPILRGLLKASESQVYYPTIETTGHVISADNIINLAALQAEGKLEAGDKVLTFMAGYGSNWQGVLLEAV